MRTRGGGTGEKEFAYLPVLPTVMKEVETPIDPNPVF